MDVVPWFGRSREGRFWKPLLTVALGRAEQSSDRWCLLRGFRDWQEMKFVGEMVEARAGAEQRGFLLYVFTPALNLGAQWQKNLTTPAPRPPEAPGPE